MASATTGQDLKEAIAERKHVTVLFADIVNSTHLIRGLDAEQSVHLLDEVVAGMVAAVQMEEGRVLRLQGDGIKAVFGAPYAQEDHAERACYAALEIHDSARRKNVRVRVGLNSGEVVTRSVPLEQGPVYEAGGMAVHLAARMEQFAAPGSTCLSETTARLVRSRFRVRHLKPRKAKGVADVVQVFVLMSRMPSRSRWEARAAYGGVGPLVGRSSELTLLTRALADVATGHGATFALVGPPGIGKSRLVFELLRDKILSRWTCFRMFAEATDVHTGLRPFANMLRAWLHIGQQTARGDAWREAERRLSELGGLQAEDLGALAALLDLTGMGNAVTGSDLRGAIIIAVRKLLHACASRGPVILVAEDIHWLDTDSKDLLCAIMSIPEHVPMAVMVTYRPGYPAEPVEGLVNVRVDLPPLDGDQARDLLTGRLGCHRSLEALKKQIVERAGGTPLFLEEMAREMIDGGLLNRRDAGFELAGSGAALSLPPTINTLLSERLDRLPGRLKMFVRLVSVIGQEAPLPLVLQLLPPGHANVELDLSDLMTAGVLLPSGTEDDRRVRFNHALAQEAAYEGILKEDRRTMHHRVFRAYEDLYAERRDEHAEVLALHAQRAALWPEALRYLRLAAARAIQRSSHSSAIAHVNCALQIIASERLTDNETELQLRLLLRTAYNAIGNYRQRLSNLDRAQVLANITRHREIGPEVMVSRASVLLQLGKPVEALRICEEAQHLVGPEASNALKIRAGYMLSRSLYYNGWPGRALTLAMATLDLLQQDQNILLQKGGFGDPKVMLLTLIAQAQASLGHLQHALQTGRSALDIASSGQRTWDVGLATFGLGVAHFYQNDLSPAVPLLEKALQVSKAGGGDDSFFGLLTGLLGCAYVESGHHQQGIQLCREALGLPEESYHHSNWIRLCCASAFYRGGLSADAADLAREANVRAKRWSYPIQLAWSDLLLAAIHSLESPDKARRHLDCLFEISRTRRLRPFLARGLIVLARLEHPGPRRDDILRHGMRLVRSMGLKLPAEALAP